MPGTTPNRGYPYPLGGDPIDISGDIRRLAEDIDSDVQSVAVAPVLSALFALSADISVPNGTVTPIPWNVRSGESSFANPAQPTRLICPTAGTYLLNVGVTLGISTAGVGNTADAFCNRNGVNGTGAAFPRYGSTAQAVPEAGGKLGLTFGRVVTASPGDYFEVICYHNSGSAQFVWGNNRAPQISYATLTRLA